jgi:putative flippase GtrA
LKLLFKYSFFAFIAITANIGVQSFSHAVYKGEYSLYIGMLFGTTIGLLVKFILDKKYIFHYESKGASDNLIKLFLYTVVGIITTALFWGLEISFDALFKSNLAKYLGAAIGLTFGYTLKYFLDKKFVFN